jgi:hypothetical protein
LKVLFDQEAKQAGEAAEKAAREQAAITAQDLKAAEAQARFNPYRT